MYKKGRMDDCDASKTKNLRLENFALHFIHKLNIQLLHQIGFCLTCSCQHPMVLTNQHEDQMANFLFIKINILIVGLKLNN
jgi:hypothetical protein